MWHKLRIILFCLLFVTPCFAQGLPPLGIQDEGGAISRPTFVLDCVGTGVECTHAGITGTITVTDTNTTYTGGTNLTLSGTTFNVDDAFVINSGADTMAGALTINPGTLFLQEQAAASADVAGQGQIWVKTATPNELWFTDDAGTDVQLGGSATDTVAGIVELATTAETTTGTDTNRAVTPDGLSGSIYGRKTVVIKVLAEATAVATGDGKAYFTVPVDLNGMNLVDADAAVYTASSSGTPTVQIHNLTDAQDMLSTRITIDAETAATGSVELTGGAAGSVDSVTVNSVTVTSGAVAFDTSLSTTATNLASNITTHTSDPNYTASADGAVVTITASTPGTGSNGYVVASNTTTITTTDTNMSGGTTEYNSYTATTAPVINTAYDDVATGDRLRIDVDVAGTGTKGLDVILVFQTP